MTAGGLFMNGAANASLVADANYTYINGPTTADRGFILVGGSSVNNYYINTNHVFQNRAGTQTAALGNGVVP
jgi:hypothetical protein